jgi:hypothetical protein
MDHRGISHTVDRKGTCRAVGAANSDISRDFWCLFTALKIMATSFSTFPSLSPYIYLIPPTVRNRRITY